MIIESDSDDEREADDEAEEANDERAVPETDLDEVPETETNAVIDHAKDEICQLDFEKMLKSLKMMEYSVLFVALRSLMMLEMK